MYVISSPVTMLSAHRDAVSSPVTVVLPPSWSVLCPQIMLSTACGESFSQMIPCGAIPFQYPELL